MLSNAIVRKESLTISGLITLCMLSRCSIELMRGKVGSSSNGGQNGCNGLTCG
jgi:hypothetical protein